MCSGILLAKGKVTYEEIPEYFGVWPEQIADFLALAGDAVDNIKGCARRRSQDGDCPAGALRFPGRMSTRISKQCTRLIAVGAKTLGAQNLRITRLTQCWPGS